MAQVYTVFTIMGENLLSQCSTVLLQQACKKGEGDVITKHQA